MTFYQYGRDFPSPISPEHTELQAFRYIDIRDKGGIDIRRDIPPKRLVFEHKGAVLSIDVFLHLSYYGLSEFLRTLGQFHLRYGYFEKRFNLREPAGRVLCAGRMSYTGSLSSSK